MAKLKWQGSFLLIAAIAVLFSACSSSKKVQKRDIRGSWIITSATVEGISGTKLKTLAFDDVAVECFNGSQWYLPNNGYGTYNISSSACLAGEHKIIWSIRSSNGADYFNFKKLDGVKKSQAKKVEDGYSLEITSQTSGAFTARSPIEFEGKTIYVVYNFAKQ